MVPLKPILCRALFRPTLWVSEFMCGVGLWHRWDWIDEHVLLGQAPRRSDVTRLTDLGIRAVVNMCAEYGGLVAEWSAAGVDHLHIPTLDYTCPTLADLDRGVRYLLERTERGEKVYIHCKAGRTRSAAVTLCYLIAHYGLTIEEAFERLRRARRQVTRSLPRQPAIQEFAQKTQSQNKHVRNA